MGNCISNDTAHYNYNNTTYRNYCKTCNMFISPNFTLEKHCCKCKQNYHYKHKHCCYCKKSYPEWHICECKNCDLRSSNKITKNMQHTLCKKCGEQCSYNHICKNYVKKDKIMRVVISEPISCKEENGICDICFQKKEIKSLKCCNNTKYICKECCREIEKCCPFCRKNISFA
jgi:hypothetical protein